MIFKVTQAKTDGIISKLWFGHNLEHTRSCLWQGLSAQLIHNRKFAGKATRYGVPEKWYGIGLKEALFTHDELADKGLLPYVQHYDPKDRRRLLETQRERIFSRSHKPAGMGQKGIPIIAGKNYECRMALFAEPAMWVSVKLVSGGGRVFHDETLRVTAKGWQDFRFVFTSPKTDTDGRLEITFHQPGELWIGAASLLPEDNFHGMRKDVIALLKQIGVPILRWPGGNFAGDYRWQDGLLPVDQRAPLQSFMPIETQPHTLGFDFHEIGTDEFIALCRELDAEPFLTINPAWESPELSAAWVEYCNGDLDTKWGTVRAERGHSKPYAVKYWSVGNEIGYSHMEGPNEPARYARRAQEYTKAMRRVSPDIIITASGHWYDDKWFAEGLKNFSDDIANLSHHRYTYPGNAYARDGGDVQFARVAKGDVDNLQELKRIRMMIEKYKPGRKDIGISFDEWNVWHSWYAYPRVVEALYAGSMINMLCRESRNVGVTLGCYFEPVNEGAIYCEPDGAVLSTIGQVMALFKEHYGNALVELKGFRPGGDIDATASMKANGEIAVSLVNRNRHKEAHANIDFKGTLRVISSKLLRAKKETAIMLDERNTDIAINGSRLTVIMPKQSVALVKVKHL